MLTNIHSDFQGSSDPKLVPSGEFVFCAVKELLLKKQLTEKRKL